MSTENSHLSSRDYAREADATRHRLAKDLDELSNRLTPGQVFDEVLTYARGGSGTFLKTLSNAAKDNPIPSLLIGTGCMLFLSEKMGLRGQEAGAWRRSASDDRIAEGMSQSGHHGRSAMDSVRSSMRAAADYAGGQTSEMAHGLKRGAASAVGAAEGGLEAVTGAVSGSARKVSETAQSGFDAVSGTISDAGQRLRETVHDIRDLAAEGSEHVKEGALSYSHTMGDQMSAMQRQAGDAGRKLTDRTTAFVNDQPLLVAALGVAVGAALAALLPSTRAEDEIMGSASDAVKKAAGTVASEQLETAKAAAERVAEKALNVAEREGLTVAGAVETARKVGSKVRQVVGEAAEAGKSELEGMAKTESRN